jgi:hypothetical protein
MKRIGGRNKRQYRSQAPLTSPKQTESSTELTNQSKKKKQQLVTAPNNPPTNDRKRLLQMERELVEANPWMDLPGISCTRGILSSSLVSLSASMRTIYAPFYVHNSTPLNRPNIFPLSNEIKIGTTFFSPLGAKSSEREKREIALQQSKQTEDSFMLPTFVPCKAPSDTWEELDAKLRLPLPVHRKDIFGNSDEIDEIFSTSRMRGIQRRSLAVVLISGPTGSGKTLASISACHTNNRCCVVVDGTEFTRDPTKNCKLLQRHLFPCRQRIVVFRGMQCLTVEQAQLFSTYFERNVFAMPRRHNLCFILADTSGCSLFRVLSKNELFSESRLCRRIYLHRATEQNMKQALLAWKWNDVSEGISFKSLGARANGDFRALRGMFDRGGEWFRCAGAACTDHLSDPFVLVPSMWGGIPGEVKPINLQDSSRRKALAESVAEVIHDVAGVFQENYWRVIKRDKCSIDQMSELSDMLSTVNLLSAWREGDGEVGDYDFMAGQFGSQLMVSCCAAMNGCLASISPGCSSWKYPSQVIEENKILMIEQHRETRMLAIPKNEHSSSAPTSIQDFLGGFGSDDILGRSKGKRAITAEQALAWPVVLHRM